MPGCSLQKDLLLFELYCASQRGSSMSVEQGGICHEAEPLGAWQGWQHSIGARKRARAVPKVTTRSGGIQWLPRAALPASQKGHMASGQEALTWALLPGTEHQSGGWQGQEGSLQNLDHKKTPNQPLSGFCCLLLSCSLSWEVLQRDSGGLTGGEAGTTQPGKKRAIITRGQIIILRMSRAQGKRRGNRNCWKQTVWRINYSSIGPI